MFLVTLFSVPDITLKIVDFFYNCIIKNLLIFSFCEVICCNVLLLQTNLNKTLKWERKIHWRGNLFLLEFQNNQNCIELKNILLKKCYYKISKRNIICTTKIIFNLNCSNHWIWNEGRKSNAFEDLGCILLALLKISC